ncbi:lipopolysaccharide heptosyltransferase RfaC [Pasteurellaceae bacterium LIM206]|nr:lipopolysaccharide heptosyltransferase RfaC [Pasteurellaceae bacterium LIM206]
MKVCLIKTSSMGDILHTLPALTDAKSALSDLQVDWVVEEDFVEIPRWHAAVERVIPIALRRWRKSPCSAQTRQEWQTYRTLLRRDQYDAVIDAQGLVKSALFAARLARGTTHGYDKYSIREPLARFFYHRKYAISYQQHAVERIRQLFARSLNYPSPDSYGDYGIARHFSHKTLQRETSPYIIFIHGTTRKDKCWLDIEWTKLARRLIERGYIIRLPWGNEADHQRALFIAQGGEHIQILPRLSLTELAEQITHSAAVVSVDTGLAHLTAALDKPNVTLYGATDPNLIGTYGKNQYHLHKTAMDQIYADEVFAKLLEIGIG